VSELTSALNDLQSGGNVGNNLVNDLMTSSNNVEIANGRNHADINGTYIHWNPNNTSGGIDANGNTNRPAFISLGHEMAHIQDVWNGTFDNSTWVTVENKPILNADKYATHIENQLRSENRIPLRTHYAIDGSTGLGVESTRIVIGRMSLFYTQPLKINNNIYRIPLIY
jgi:hypothetical protein